MQDVRGRMGAVVRRFSLKHWDKSAALEGLQYFVQRLEEMLYSCSAESYRSPVMSPRAVCREAQQLIRSVKAREAKRPSLSPVLREAAAALRGDAVATAIVGETTVEAIALDLENDKLDVNEIEARIEYVIARMPAERYMDELRRQLLEAVGNASDKSPIEALTRTLVSELVAGGYSKPFIYVVMKNYFHASRPIKSPRALDAFLNNFDFQEHDYTIILHATPVLRRVQNFLTEALPAEWTLSLLDSWNEPTIDDRHLAYVSTPRYDKDVLVRVDGVKGLSPNAALDAVIRRLLFVANTVAYVHHETRLEWSKDACVLLPERSVAVVITTTVSAMLLRHDPSWPEAVKQLEAVLHMTLADRASIQKYTRVFDLHEMALRTEEPANQLLDLWAIMEALVPSLHESERAQIETILQAAVPLLMYGYIYELVATFYFDVRSWRKAIIGTYLDQVPITSANPVVRTAALLSTPECSGLRDTMTAELDRFVLLRNRFFVLHRSLSSVGSVRRAIESHEQRLRWQLYRVYRTRNQVVHEGELPPYTDLLVANLHSYVDSAVSTLTSMHSSALGIGTIEQGLVQAQLSLRGQRSALEGRRDREPSLADFEELLFPAACVLLA